ncbi:hypothetical protein [Sulfuracidifex tepidarius]|uniref:Uncharacterized protein n=1 Tax=Sulfuracidifex tepidarius TaxID=1294262 RepID=A0A510DS96_9CREN|nr:hypothetical protein [Sulfuracidifex tepidarius]BBG23000.1 hypothetical protein IC006_0284 [Sulfuracidifex tepidarius]BBG25761.1 hypothetical protein IC007_0266 [Sulfuracidifex tepidarius]
MESERIFRLLTGTASFLWSLLHLVVGYGAASLAAHATGEAVLSFAIYSEYFGFNSALYIFAGYEILKGTRKLLPLIIFLFTINTGLLIESHVAPAPILGRTLPIIPEVFPALVLDFVLLGGSILTWWKANVRV